MACPGRCPTENWNQERIKTTENWNQERIKTIYEDCHAAMKFLDNSRVISQKYRKFVERERGAIIEKMVDLIMDEAYVGMEPESKEFVVYWTFAPQWLVEFLRRVGFVFTGDSELEIRKKILDPSMVVETSEAAEAPLPKPTECWNEDRIKTLFRYCRDAMAYLDSWPTRFENYRQCLRRGRDAIIENMMEFIMNAGFFKMQYGTSDYVLYWRDAPQGLARFLQHLEVVFIGNEEVKIRKKRAAPLVAVAAVAEASFLKSTMVSLAQAAIYDILKEGLAYVYEELTKKDEQKIPPIAVLVGLVEAPEPRLKCGILRSYGEMKKEHFAEMKKKNFADMNLSDGDKELCKDFLRGKRIFNEKWAEEGETYELTGEAKAMLCMHLWSLMRYAGFSKSDKIWKVIREKWQECVSWNTESETESCGNFWKILELQPESDLRVETKKAGLRTILDAYKDMDKYFAENKDIGLTLEYYPTAYGKDEYDPHNDFGP